MNNISEFKCFIASPGDTAEERDACEQVFEEINKSIGKVMGFRLSSLRWEKDVYSSVGEYGQDVINTQIDGNYDFFIGIMKARFGTPTPKAGSGTEEEFDIAYEKCINKEIKNIFFYFGNPNISLSNVDPYQLSKVREFQKKLEDNKVLYVQYTDVTSFKERLKQDLENYFRQNNLSTKKGGEVVAKTIAKAKSQTYDYRKLWEEARERVYKKKNITEITKKIVTKKKTNRFVKVIFPQESLINLLMKKEPLNEEKACLFALAVSDIGQIPSYYNVYHIDDAELNKQSLWIQLKEREKTLGGSNRPLLNDLTSDWGIYEQIQRHLFHFDFLQAKELVDKWDAKGYWIQAKAMRMAVYPELRKEVQSLLDNTIKKEKNPSEKLFEVILANYISRQWPYPYSTDEFWKYGLEGQGDLLNSMMSALRGKEEKPKRRGWIGSTTYFGNNHGDYVKSLRILQFIVDSGIYLYLPGSYLFEIASWYKVFLNLYEHFPYPCFFYSIQYNDKEVQRRIGEDFAYSEESQKFVQDILKKSLSAIINLATPPSFKTGILNVTAAMYVAVDEDEWFELFKETVFKELLDWLNDIEDSNELVFNVKLALGSLKKRENISWGFLQLMNNYTRNESIISDIIVYNLRISRVSSENALKDTSIFPDLLSSDALNLLDTLNSSNLVSEKCRKEICEKIVNTPEENIPHNRIALLQLVNLTKYNQTALKKIKKCLLSMDIWHCGVLNDSEFGWTEPQYIMLHLLNDKVTWTDEEFDIIKENLIRNVISYDKIHEKLHQDSFMKNVQVRYLSSMLKFIDKLDELRSKQLSEARTNVQRLLEDRIQFANNIDLMMSEQPADVDYAFNNICEGVTNYGIKKYQDDIDFMIDRAIMRNSIALTCNLKYINILVNKYGQDMTDLGYIRKIRKLLSIFKDNGTWELLDLRFAFNYLYRIAKKLSEFGESDEAIEFWLNNEFVKKFVVE